MQATDDELLISDPVMGRTTQTHVDRLLRRLRYPDGSTAGLITLSIDPNFIEPFYRSVDLGVTAHLDAQHGRLILAAKGYSTELIGDKPTRQMLSSESATSSSGHYWGHGNIDGTIRLIATAPPIASH